MHIVQTSNVPAIWAGQLQCRRISIRQASLRAQKVTFSLTTNKRGEGGWSRGWGSYRRAVGAHKGQQEGHSPSPCTIEGARGEGVSDTETFRPSYKDIS